MKTIFTLLASSMISVTMFAANITPAASMITPSAEIKPTSSVTIRSADNSNIRVVLDGKRFEPNDNAVVIGGLTEGYHSVKVYKQSGSYYNMKSARFEMIYNGSLDIKRRTSLSLTIGRNNQVTMKETRITGQGRNSDDDYDYGNDGEWGDYDNNGGYSSGMNSRDFDRLLVTIDKEWLEGNKIKSATQVVRSNSFTSAQVKQLVQLFSFENNKLELAKQAYQNTVDKRNYYLVSNTLTFNNSKVELDRFIRNGR